MNMEVEIYDRNVEAKTIKRNVRNIVESRHTFKMQYFDGSFSGEYSKTSCDYYVIKN